jgi:hypothetical protein
MGLLLGIVYWIVIEVRSCSILSVFFINCSEQTPPLGSSPANTVPPLLADTSPDIKQLLPQSDEDRIHTYKNILETTLEPAVIESQGLILENEEARKYFLELDIFKRRLSQSFYDLYQVGLNETISSTHLDFEELERDIHSMY